MGARMLTMDEIIPENSLPDYDGRHVQAAWLSPDGQYHECTVFIERDKMKMLFMDDTYRSMYKSDFPRHLTDSVRFFPVDGDRYRIIRNNGGRMETITPIACTVTSRGKYIISTCNEQRLVIDEDNIQCVMVTSRYYEDPTAVNQNTAPMDTNTRIENATDDNTTIERTTQTGAGATSTGTTNDDATGTTGTGTGKNNASIMIDLGKQPVFHNDHQRRDKWQALKVLEESAEIVETCKQYLTDDTLGTAPIALEIADLLQTTVNLIDAYGITQDQLNEAIRETILKNKDRGMFTSGERTHMHRDNDDNGE